MRMYAYLKEPYPCNKTEMIYKVMIHKLPKKQGVHTYYYTARDALFSSYDSFSDSVEDAMEEFEENDIDEQGWIVIDDPLPGCSTCCVVPIREKGWETENLQEDSYEILENGEWKEFRIRSSRRHKEINYEILEDGEWRKYNPPKN